MIIPQLLHSLQSLINVSFNQPLTPVIYYYAITIKVNFYIIEPEGRENERGLLVPKTRSTPNVDFLHREYWDADPPKSVEYLSTPISHIRFTYTNSPPCQDLDECINAVKELQTEHMNQGLSDIKYK